MITPADLANPKLVSGFKFVRSVTPSAAGHAGKTMYSSYRGPNSSGGGRYGRNYDTALEAAQDYCDYVNGRERAAVAALKSAGHTYQNIYAKASDPEVEAALGVLRDAAAQRKGRPGFVYLISDGTAYKIGYSVNPEKRVAELQTGNPRLLRLVKKMSGTEADEKALHQKFIQYNLLQEWFRPMSEILAAFH